MLQQTVSDSSTVSSTLCYAVSESSNSDRAATNQTVIVRLQQEKNLDMLQSQQPVWPTLLKNERGIDGIVHMKFAPGVYSHI